MTAEEKLEIMKKHSDEFMQPILIMMDLTSLHLPDAEMIKHEDFKKAGSLMREIARQGFKEPFTDFVNIVLGYIKYGV